MAITDAAGIAAEALQNKAHCGLAARGVANDLQFHVIVSWQRNCDRLKQCDSICPGAGCLRSCALPGAAGARRAGWQRRTRRKLRRPQAAMPATMRAGDPEDYGNRVVGTRRPRPQRLRSARDADRLGHRPGQRGERPTRPRMDDHRRRHGDRDRARRVLSRPGPITAACPDRRSAAPRASGCASISPTARRIRTPCTSTASTRRGWTAFPAPGWCSRASRSPTSSTRSPSAATSITAIRCR